nr:MerR family transcriptional regulator [Brevibacterium permense]
MSRRTGVPTRMLRYYEEQGLIAPRRRENGYREYGEYLVDRVRKIRELLDSGIPTRIIGDMLPCLDDTSDTVIAEPDPELRALLVEQRDKMSERITVLEHNRDALDRYIVAMDRAERDVADGAVSTV